MLMPVNVRGENSVVRNKKVNLRKYFLKYILLPDSILLNELLKLREPMKAIDRCLGGVFIRVPGLLREK